MQSFIVRIVTLTLWDSIYSLYTPDRTELHSVRDATIIYAQTCNRLLINAH